jgi:hypothetical protein
MLLYLFKNNKTEVKIQKKIVRQVVNESKFFKVLLLHTNFENPTFSNSSVSAT